MTEKAEEFQIRFTGELHEIDANTLLDTLGNVSVVLHEINTDLRPEHPIKVRIKAISPGSFDIFLIIKDLVSDNVGQYFTKTNLDIAGTIIISFWGLLEIRKHLKGKKPSKVKTGRKETTLVNLDGVEINIENTVYNIYKENQIIDTALGKSFDALEADTSIDGFELSQKGKMFFRADRADFKALSLPSAMPPQDTRVLSEDAKLTVFKIVFEKGYKWQFYYKGIKIGVEIKDEAFYEAIDAGAKFAKGDTLIVKLEIIQVFDKSVNVYINKDYRVVKILQHIPRPTQQKLL